VIQVFPDIFIVCLGLIIAVAICCLWAKLGGDENFEKHHSDARFALHIIHHWMFGLVLFAASFVLSLTNVFIDYPFLVYFILGLGTGLFIDDTIFHNCECYFQRKVE
jgi:hypothetical protein